MGNLTARLKADPAITPLQEQHLVAYLTVLPRDLRFALVKTLITIPPVALSLVNDKYDTVVLDAVRAINAEAG
jgi:hypothetical protein